MRRLLPARSGPASPRAFRHDDGTSAFALALPAVREILESGERFMAMMQRRPGGGWRIDGCIPMVGAGRAA